MFRNLTGTQFLFREKEHNGISFIFERNFFVHIIFLNMGNLNIFYNNFKKFSLYFNELCYTTINNNINV